MAIVIIVVKGVSSSAAIELATAYAIMGAFCLKLSPQQVSLLCQKAENLIVGAACGIMDQAGLLLFFYKCS